VQRDIADLAKGPVCLEDTGGNVIESLGTPTLTNEGLREYQFTIEEQRRRGVMTLGKELISRLRKALRKLMKPLNRLQK